MVESWEMLRNDRILVNTAFNASILFMVLSKMYFLSSGEKHR